MVKSKDPGDIAITAVSYFFVTLMALLCVLPVLHTVAVSFSQKAAAEANLVVFWPVNATFSSYREILNDQQFFTSFGISVLRVLLGGSINLVLTVLMAFPLSKSRQAFPQRNLYMWVLVFCMLFSGGLIPSYLLIHSLKLVNTLWALVLPGAVPIFNVIILMNYFRGLPAEIEEAARIDGASPWVIMIKIFVPLAVPSIATVTLFSVVGHWNAFFDGMIYINSANKLPLQTYIQQLVVQVINVNNMTPDQIAKLSQVSSKTFNAAKVFVTMVPVLCVYPFLQKYFVTGLVMGSVKG